jgi:hypothetical protein
MVIRWENKRYWTEEQKEFPQFKLPLISMQVKFWFIIIVISKYLNCATFLHDWTTIFYVLIFFCIPVTRHAHTVFSVFTCTRSSLTATDRGCCSLYTFPFLCYYKLPLTEQTIANISDSVSIPLHISLIASNGSCFLGLSCMLSTLVIQSICYWFQSSA